MKVDTLTESDADTMTRSLLELLGVSDLVGWYTKICLAYPPKISTLEQQEACFTFCQRCFASFWTCVSFWQSIYSWLLKLILEWHSVNEQWSSCDRWRWGEVRRCTWLVTAWTPSLTANVTRHATSSNTWQMTEYAPENKGSIQWMQWCKTCKTLK